MGLVTSHEPGVFTYPGSDISTPHGPRIVTSHRPGIVTSHRPGIVTSQVPCIFAWFGLDMVTVDQVWSDTRGPGISTFYRPDIVTSHGSSIVTFRRPDIVTTNGPGSFISPGLDIYVSRPWFSLILWTECNHISWYRYLCVPVMVRSHVLANVTSDATCTCHCSWTRHSRISRTEHIHISRTRYSHNS